VVILPGPSGSRGGDNAPAASPAAGAGNEGKPGDALRPGLIDGFDPAAARRNAARDAARALNAQRSNVPPSVAPSLSERERMAKNVENAVLPDCSETAKGLGLFNAPVIIAGVLIDKGCRLR
jgi:enoyl-CoA hydratase/carnithine racemase